MHCGYRVLTVVFEQLFVDATVNVFHAVQRLEHIFHYSYDCFCCYFIVIVS